MLVNMKYGSWITAILFSILAAYTILVLCILVAILVSEGLAGITMLAPLFVIFTMVYLGLSIAGWLFIGIPTHLILCTWFEPKYLYYLGVCIILFFILLGVYGLGAAAFFSFTILLQAMIFRYLAFELRKNPLTTHEPKDTPAVRGKGR